MPIVKFDSRCIYFLSPVPKRLSIGREWNEARVRLGPGQRHSTGVGLRLFTDRSTARFTATYRHLPPTRRYLCLSICTYRKRRQTHLRGPCNLMFYAFVAITVTPWNNVVNNTTFVMLGTFDAFITYSRKCKRSQRVAAETQIHRSLISIYCHNCANNREKQIQRSTGFVLLL